MKLLLVITLTLCCCLPSFAGPSSDTVHGVTPEQEAQAKAWLDDLYEVGVVVKGDSIYISEDARRVALDTTYRKFIYRDTYNWPEATYLLKNNYLKIGFWHLINLYDQDTSNREAVLQYILTLDGTLEMDKVLIATFYTYALLDAQVGTIKNGRPQITRPDIVERKLAVVNTLVNYIVAQRRRSSPRK